MFKKKNIGKLIAVKFTDREALLHGLVIDYNDEWTLMKYNPVDYIIDGYVIFKHKNIEWAKRESKEIFKEKVILTKGESIKTKEMVPLSNLATILKFLTKKYGVFQLHTRKEKSFYLGSFQSIDSKELFINNLSPDGQWDMVIKYRPFEIRFIFFGNDYDKSLKLYAEKYSKWLPPSVKIRKN